MNDPLQFPIDDYYCTETNNFINNSVTRLNSQNNSYEPNQRVQILTKSIEEHFNPSTNYSPSTTVEKIIHLPLLEGEIIKNEHKGFIFEKIHTSIYITNHRLILYFHSTEECMTFPFFCLLKIKITEHNGVCYTFYFKDCQIITLSAYEPSTPCTSFVQMIRQMIETYCPIDFVMRGVGGKHGWSSYNIYNEFSRMRLEGEWKVCEYNSKYEICNTYPTQLIVPMDIHKSTLMASSEFRTNGRIPVLTWIHPQTRKVLLRSSQPKTGFTGKSDEDVTLLYREGGGSYIQIYDCRDYYSALGNKAFKQAGFESISEYTFCSIEFLNIPNIHRVKEAFNECYDIFLTQDETMSILPIIYKSEWIKYIQILLQSTQTVSNMLENKSVLVHCSDGWDRTSQICSLVELMLDPFYRTISGFAVLIEKDWLSFGHQFQTRSGITHDTTNTSPIFLQFLHCVHVLLKQNPYSFEFNDKLLQFLADELFTFKYGTFAFNCEKDRKEIKASLYSASIWDDVINMTEFINEHFKLSSNPLTLNTSLLCISSWLNYFIRYSQPLISQKTLY
ncbi:myotubularin, putative [Entamoeba histolytica HM-1:IMSS-B]|uniref:Myotubularin, putative n=6 Tax=Entamoeba histolytica TaxID=5759 RepID=C4LUH7_ENTH1|nr:myotubularin, putative [Entamoeba histolytica HM-1:IMSS]EMD45089.1 myotubularin, putative [Entamoeba histolytica KU27]EMH77579.1 myotubularin, putative [Entamoeba histolytica HM-1:IMSS-B]EMS16959.1 myotubularin, putative [Entamoeba histolytica HM-3:IMSS]ENY65957.1 myotubularin, putative [Entamoeba histolytica HM-1:IMSS-A]GAT92265.1 myotubularin putative [Entamoeba histolytica]|eukprot:XP_657184.1 myotubularin, putative [Entamoeba histolytica HM-1:IMSS]